MLMFPGSRLPSSLTSSAWMTDTSVPASPLTRSLHTPEMFFPKSNMYDVSPNDLTATGSISSVGLICGIFWATSRGDGSGTSLAVLHEESSNPVSYHPAISFLAS